MTAPLSDLLPPVPADLIEFISRHSGFVVLGHLEPDGDCVGSELALASLLRRRGFSVQVLNPGPFERVEIAAFGEQFDSVVDRSRLGDSPAAIVVDCSSDDRIGAFAAEIADFPVAVIDHHRTGTPFGSVHYIEPTVPATTILITALLLELGETPTREEATLLFLGLVTDTGFFRFLDEGETTAFAAAAVLSSAGASPRDIDARLASGRSFASRRLIGRMLERVEQLAEGRILLTYHTALDETELGKRRDSDALYRLLLAIEDVEVIAVVKEKSEGCTISLRATQDVDVSRIAARLGGGGHARAAGAMVRKPLLEVLSDVRNELVNTAL